MSDIPRQTIKNRIGCPNCSNLIDLPNHPEGKKWERIACGACMTEFPIELAKDRSWMMKPEEIPWSPYYKGVDVWNLEPWHKEWKKNNSACTSINLNVDNSKEES